MHATALLMAANAGDVRMLDLVAAFNPACVSLDNHFLLRFLARRESTALEGCCSVDHACAVYPKLVNDYGMDVHVNEDEPLGAIVSRGCAREARVLIDTCGADPLARGGEFFAHAVRSNDLDTVRLLASHGVMAPESVFVRCAKISVKTLFELMLIPSSVLVSPEIVDFVVQFAKSHRDLLRTDAEFRDVCANALSLACYHDKAHLTHIILYSDFITTSDYAMYTSLFSTLFNDSVACLDELWNKWADTVGLSHAVVEHLLIEASSRGKVRTTRYLLYSNVDQDTDNGAPLKGAVSYGSREVVEMLLQRGADLSREDFIVFHIAVQAKSEGVMIALLLHAQARSSSSSSSSSSSFHCSPLPFEAGQEERLRVKLRLFLIQSTRGVVVIHDGVEKRTCGCCSCSTKRLKFPVIQAILASAFFRADPACMGDALRAAVLTGDVPHVTNLLVNGALDVSDSMTNIATTDNNDLRPDMTERYLFDEPPLNIAALLKDINIVSLLLAYGADPTSNNNEILVWTAMNGEVDVLRILLKAVEMRRAVASSVTTRKQSLETAYFNAFNLAVINDNTECVRLFISLGLAPLQDRFDGACLRNAVNAQNLDMALLLLRHGVPLVTNATEHYPLAKKEFTRAFVCFYNDYRTRMRKGDHVASPPRELSSAVCCRKKRLIVDILNDGLLSIKALSVDRENQRDVQIIYLNIRVGSIMRQRSRSGIDRGIVRTGKSADASETEASMDVNNRKRPLNTTSRSSPAKIRKRAAGENK
jgi:ankyrin repeat protein